MNRRSFLGRLSALVGVRVSPIQCRWYPQPDLSKAREVARQLAERTKAGETIALPAPGFEIVAPGTFTGKIFLAGVGDG